MGDHGRSQAARNPIHRLRTELPDDRWHRSYGDADSADPPSEQFRVTSGVQPDVHDAWHDDDLFRRHAAGIRVCELFASPDDRRTRHGVSALERVQLLVDGFRWNPALLQLYRRLRSVWRRERSGCRVVRLCAIDRADVLARTQHGFLDSLSAGLRFWQYRDGDQHHRYRSVHALPGDDSRQDALAGLA